MIFRGAFLVEIVVVLSLRLRSHIQFNSLNVLYRGLALSIHLDDWLP